MITLPQTIVAFCVAIAKTGRYIVLGWLGAATFGA